MVYCGYGDDVYSGLYKERITSKLFRSCLKPQLPKCPLEEDENGWNGNIYVVYYGEYEVREFIQFRAQQSADLSCMFFMESF